MYALTHLPLPRPLPRTLRGGILLSLRRRLPIHRDLHPRACPHPQVVYRIHDIRTNILSKPENKLYFERAISRFCRVQVGGFVTVDGALLGE